MEEREKKILHLKVGLTILKILAERKKIAEANKTKGKKDHKLISSLRKLAAASGIDFGTIQKISKGDQGMEFFTLMDIIEALDLDIVTFGEYFNSISIQDINNYQASIQKSRKEKKK
ncbi:MAG: hypothetical protein JSS98_17865 [Bacteroidetes bacterium]|nr:hypothetical protein [Bacteroidota bacterium]